MSETQSQNSTTTVKREESEGAESRERSPPRIAHTLTACVRCRNRKTRCDPGLPRCGPCERTNSHCEYFDQTKGVRIPRNYVVYLQHKVRELEMEFENLEKEEPEPDPEDLMRSAAAVRVTPGAETKFLGPSSGITVTRLVMQLAKQFTDSRSITDIISDTRARSIKERFAQEQAKPTSKVYPLISDVAAEELPNRDLTSLLVQLFNLKVQPMYPIFHEPTFARDVDDVYKGCANPGQDFTVRMVIAISLQKMDTQYAGLADSYYLAALEYFAAATRSNDLRTLQCYALIAGYSLLTPTRTAVYYVIGLAVRLFQALGMHEEKSIRFDKNGNELDPLEVDMRRRLFWITLTMDLGLSHSLGRPSAFAMSKDHVDVEFFSSCDDQYISATGIYPAQPSLKKWIAQHFYRMRMLQLEIRRTLYQEKRPEPKDDRDPWFKQMEENLVAWRDASPNVDGGSGLDKVWFIGRYNTMMVFLFRPSPQVPKPSVKAARICYDACEYYIQMARKQIETKTIDLTWIFTQAIFMSINTMLWSISYQDVRRQHSREDVERNLGTALESIGLASERWPGVESAMDLYQTLIAACIRSFDKDGDIPINASSPSEVASNTSSYMEGLNGSRTTSPATVSTSSVATPPEKPQTAFTYIAPQGSAQPVKSHHPPTSYPASLTSSPPVMKSSPYHTPNRDNTSGSVKSSPQYANRDKAPFDPASQFNPLPNFFGEAINWNPAFAMSSNADLFGESAGSTAQGTPLAGPIRFDGHMSNDSPFGPASTAPGYMCLPDAMFDRRGGRLSQVQHLELMQTLETQGMGQIENMIEESSALFGRQSQVPGY